MLAGLVSGEGPLSGLQMAVFSLHHHMVQNREKKSKSSPVSFYEGSNAIYKGSALMT